MSLTPEWNKWKELVDLRFDEHFDKVFKDYGGICSYFIRPSDLTSKLV